MDATELLLLLLALFLVLLNGFFVAAEFAFVKVRASRIEQLVREGARSSGRVARQILGQLDGYLSACQFGITLASLGLGWVGEPALAAWFEPLFEALGVAAPAAAHAAAVVLAFTLITFLHVVVGEQAPKSLGIMRAESVALWSAWPLRLFYVLAYPAIALLNGSTNAFLRLLGLPPASEHEHAHSPEELSLAVETSHEQGLLDAEQRRLLDNALALRNRCLREIMVPRPDMHVLDLEASVERNIETLCRHHHTRYPLARGDADRIVGMIHIKDLVPFPCDTKREHGERGEETSRLLEPERLLAIARPITFIPEVAPIDRALRTFQASGSHMAMVVDEWGGVVGLVTLEDVLEELVGEIRDEFDREGDAAVVVGPGGVLIAKGSWPLVEAAERLGVEFPEANVDTIAGFVMHRLGRVPKIGDVVRLGPWRIEVMRMRGLRVTAVRIVRDEQAPASRAEAGGARGGAGSREPGAGPDGRAARAPA